MTKIVGVRFRTAGKIYYFDPKNMMIKRGEHVIVETARGIEYGRVAIHKRPPKGLLAGLYELPNVEGALSDGQVLELLKKKRFSPIRILPLEGAKHIFSHVEWHMTGYVITIEEPEKETEYLFVEPRETEEKYPIPAAFAAYTKYLQIKLGQEKYREEE